MTRDEALRVLGATAQTPLADIRSAYRRLSHRHHPDKGGSAAAMARINRAWEVVQLSMGAGAKSREEAPSDPEIDIGTPLILLSVLGHPTRGRASLCIVKGEVVLDVSLDDEPVDTPSRLVLGLAAPTGEAFVLQGHVVGRVIDGARRCVWIRVGGLSSG